MSTDATPSWSDLLALVERLEVTDFEDFVVEMPGLTVRVSRHGLADAPAGTPTVDTQRAVALTAGADDVDIERKVVDGKVAVPGHAEITAPIIGVFYRGSAPEQPPLVAIGDHIAVGATTAIIEVMKMMVPVEADVSGRIVDVLAADGDLVELGQPLFIVDTSDP